MEKYMFLFRGGDVSHLSPEAQQAHMQKWFDWVDKLRKENRYLAGEALIPAGKTLAGLKKTITDGPYAEGKEITGGFFVINAKNLEEATQLAKDFPDFEYEGSVEVREVMKFDM
ncbi:MAG TPA: YciI family protein [Ohtaekwangia sp.]|uniref:YciI family protein n=1 Tax=Ohtaekwangia sp. TaxID=2066019 RepID=UPI002F933277